MTTPALKAGDLVVFKYPYPDYPLPVGTVMSFKTTVSLSEQDGPHVTSVIALVKWAEGVLTYEQLEGLLPLMSPDPSTQEAP